jgi:hypothetical protein
VTVQTVIELARRWPIVRGEIFKAMSLHLAAFAAISVTAEAWSALLRVIFDPWHRSSPPTFVNAWSALLVEQLMTFVIAYALILTVTYVVDSREKIARQMTETARLNEELSRAQLAVLRGQMDPHFMFNTLNSIASLVYDQRGDAAVGMIVGLSEFLRRASEDSHRVQVTLREEVEYLQRYIDIQKVRFGDLLKGLGNRLDRSREILCVPAPGRRHAYRAQDHPGTRAGPGRSHILTHPPLDHCQPRAGAGARAAGKRRVRGRAGLQDTPQIKPTLSQAPAGPAGRAVSLMRSNPFDIADGLGDLSKDGPRRRPLEKSRRVLARPLIRRRSAAASSGGKPRSRNGLRLIQREYFRDGEELEIDLLSLIQPLLLNSSRAGRNEGMDAVGIARRIGRQSKKRLQRLRCTPGLF